jgi:ASC-1-like (ASCH) protein
MRHHLAVLYKVYLDDIFLGRKTIECRLGRASLPPHGCIEAGDLIWLKQSGGLVRGVARVCRVQSFQSLSEEELELIRRKWNGQICAPESFWSLHDRAQAATLIWLCDICPLEPFRVHKKDRRAWVVLNGPPIPDEKLNV